MLQLSPTFVYRGPQQGQNAAFQLYTALDWPSTFVSVSTSACFRVSLIWTCTFIGWSFIRMNLLRTEMLTNYWSFIGMKLLTHTFIGMKVFLIITFKAPANKGKRPYK